MTWAEHFPLPRCAKPLLNHRSPIGQQSSRNSRLREFRPILGPAFRPTRQRSPEHVRVQDRRRRRRHDGRRDRPDAGRRRPAGSPQGRRPEVRGPGPGEGPPGDGGPAAGPGQEGEDHRGAGQAAARAHPRADHRHDHVRRLRRRRLRGRGGARADRDQAPGVRRARRRDARVTRSSPATPRRCRSPRWATRRCAPTR